MSDEIFVPQARVVGGPRVVSVTSEEEKHAVIASGADELMTGARPRGQGGWSGPGGRSAGSGIALRKFDGVTAGSEGILGLLPRGSSAPARRPVVARAVGGSGSDSRETRGASPTRGARASAAAAAHDSPPKRVGFGGDAKAGLPPKRSSHSVLSDREPVDSSRSDSRTSAASGASPPPRVASFGRRAPQGSAGSARSTGSGAAAGDASPAAATKPSRRVLARAASAEVPATSSAAASNKSTPTKGGRTGPSSGAGGDDAAAPTPRTGEYFSSGSACTPFATVVAGAFAGYTNKPSAALDPQKAASPFGAVKGKTWVLPLPLQHVAAGFHRVFVLLLQQVCDILQRRQDSRAHRSLWHWPQPDSVGHAHSA